MAVIRPNDHYVVSLRDQSCRQRHGPEDCLFVNGQSLAERLLVLNFVGVSGVFDCPTVELLRNMVITSVGNVEDVVIRAQGGHNVIRVCSRGAGATGICQHGVRPAVYAGAPWHGNNGFGGPVPMCAVTRG